MSPPKKPKPNDPVEDVVEEPAVETPEERCPHAAKDRTQCVLAVGHEGKHETRFQAKAP